MQHENCHDLLETLSDYIDGDLDANLCAELEQHLQGCKNCKVVVDTMRKTIELYQHESDSQDVPTDVKKRLFYRLGLEEFWK